MAVLIIMLMNKRNSHQNYSDYTLSDDETVDQKNASASIVKTKGIPNTEKNERDLDCWL